MLRSLITLLFFLAGWISSAGTPVEAELESMSLSQLEQRLKDIDSELKQLARLSPRGGIGSTGYSTKRSQEAQTNKSVRIPLGEESTIDQIVLVPSLYRNSEIGFRSGGFPVAFRILVGTVHASKVVASFTAKDNLLPRIAPLAVSFKPIKASWIAIEVSELSPAPNEPNIHSFQLSEVMVFNGMENVVLPRHRPGRTLRTKTSNLTDGFTPFLMNAAQGPSSQSRIIRLTPPGSAPTSEPSSLPTLTIDLKSPKAVDQINLHTADTVLSVPMSQLSCWAVPRHIRVMGALSSDFSDETLLCEYKQKSFNDNGPVLMRRFPEAQCRYIRLIIVDHLPIVSLKKNMGRIAFSEVEVLSKNKNIALQAVVTASSNLTYSSDALPRITDGLNYYGKILPLRDWMNQLARRHDLEVERPLVAEALSHRRLSEKAKLRRMIWLASLIAAIIVIGFLIERLLYHKKMKKMRVRFAADLHDELGANLHTIALLSDAATVARDTDEEWQMLHQRIRRLTARTGTAIQRFSNIVNADGFYRGLVDDMQRVSRRILAKIDHTIEISGEEYLEDLKVNTQVDLFLFFKESLVNICRHSDATRASTNLKGTAREIILNVSDNGKGLSKKNIPSALKRRARLLKAKLTIEESPEGGTSISLRLRHRRRFWHRWHRKPKIQSHETTIIPSP